MRYRIIFFITLYAGHSLCSPEIINPRGPHFKCITNIKVNYHWEDHIFKLHGNILDFKFILKMKSPYFFRERKDNSTVPDHLQVYRVNILGIDPGSKLYDDNGVLVAELGEKVYYNSGRINSSHYTININKIYCYNAAHDPPINDKSAYGRGFRDGIIEKSKEIYNKMLQMNVDAELLKLV